MNFPPNNWR